MENLPKKINAQSVVLAIYNSTAETKAIDIRRQMIQLPEVAKLLTEVEKYIFAASTKMRIADIDDSTLIAKTGQMFRFIAMDVGYKIPTDVNDWTYICTRLLDILKKYYSQMTLADIKLAFELATTGELNEFLPKDSEGNPDKKHYQQFNADYFAKILNAYRQKQNGVINKAYQALPEPSKEFTPEQKRRYHNNAVYRHRNIFLKYKYTGRLEFGVADGMFIHEWLQKIGFADTVIGSDEDRKTAYVKYMQRVARGFGNKYETFHVQRKGTEAPELDFTAYEIARDKDIKRCFDLMIKHELQIDNYLNYWHE